MLRTPFAVLLLAVLMPSSGAAQPAQRPFVDDSKAVAAWLEANNVPALGVGIIRDGALRQVRVYGELRKGHPAPHDTIFNVASLTKPIVSMLTLRLVSAGKWNLDEPLAKYWVDPDVAEDPRHERLTTRHVLRHQTGFPNWRSSNANGKLAFEFEPGSRVQYSGEGFEYLRVALERRFDRSLAELSHEILLGPLRMTDTHHAWNEHVDETRFARWHDANAKNVSTAHRITAVNAADNLLTTVEDYGRFAASVISGNGLSPAVAEQMVSRHAKIKDNLYMGLGWEVHTDFSTGESALIHTGSDEGVHALVILLPRSRQGLVVMTNSDGGFKLYERLVLEAFDLGGELLARAGR